MQEGGSQTFCATCGHIWRATKGTDEIPLPAPTHLRREGIPGHTVV